MITSGQASKRYPDGTVAHDRLSIAAPTGQVTVLVEATGGGKATAGARALPLPNRNYGL
jgi:osmoprotectant transport system ATP-binding protein